MPEFISDTPDWDKVRTRAVAECLSNRPEGMTELQALQMRADELKAEFDTLTDQGTAIYDRAARQAAEVQRRAQAKADAVLGEARRQCAEIQAQADAQAQAARDRTPVALLEKLAIEMEIQNRTLGR